MISTLLHQRPPSAHQTNPMHHGHVVWCVLYRGHRVAQCALLRFPALLLLLLPAWMLEVRMRHSPLAAAGLLRSARNALC